MSAKTFIKMAKQKFNSKSFKQGLEESANELLSKKGTILAGAGLTAGAGLMIAEKNDFVDLGDERTQSLAKGIAIGGSAIVGALGAAKAAKVAGRLLNKTKETPWKNVRRTGVTETIMGNADNTLMSNPLAPDKKLSFYGPGGAVNQLGAVAEEGWSALKRGTSRFFDAETSIASKRVPGVSTRTAEQITTLEKIAQETELGLKSMVSKQGEKGYATELKKVLAPLKQSVKVVHHKVVNDYSNSGIFNEYFQDNTVVSDYVRKFLKAETYEGIVKQASVARGIGKESIDNMLNVQGLKTPIEKMKYVQLNNKGVSMGDMLRDIQFDPRVYNVFQNMGKKGLTKTDEVYDAMKEFFPNVKKLKDGQLQIIMSPKMKSNFDWGGSAGSVTWNPKSPDKVKFFSTDARDLFGMKLGDDVINVSTIKEIKIPKFIDKMKRETNKPTRGPDKVKRAEKRPKEYREMDVDSINTVTNNTLISKSDYERLRNIPAEFNKAKLDVRMKGATMKESIEFVGTRAATVSGGMAGLYGSYALAFGDDE
tara:strand:+ start:11273 stop:12883 length:1611 start_codon:yes stop_codon:yes gene_type:complete